ncbi:FAD-dependent oxidoreductase [Chloroflexota bacterium]
MPRLKKLFEPGRIGRLELKNRLIMAPMGMGGLIQPDGTLSQRAIDYLVERARGGVGLILTTFPRVTRVIESQRLWWYIDDAAGLKKLADGVHSHGAKVAVQMSPGFGRVANPKDPRATGPADVVAPSPLPCFFDASIMARALTVGEIEQIVQAFEVGAGIIRSAGIDAVEVHGHEGYLLDQFKTALWNQRADKYGGDLTGRMKFSMELIRAIKAGAGDDFPVIYRFGLEHHLSGGREIPEGLEIARRLEVAGVDALEVDAGCYETTWWPHPTQYQPPGCMVDLAEKTKKVVKIPVMTVGKLGYPELAERILQEGKADFIVLGRSLIADPEWANKTKETRFDDIRPCLCDHDGCSARTKGGKPLSCTVNPAAGIEKEYTITLAARKKNVLVVGGGPGGMEAAIVAASRGHKVTLWEKKQTLGGNLIPASAPDFKGDYRRLTAYLSTQLKKLDVSVELGKEATPELIQAMKPDVVFFATGSIPVIPQISGVHKRHVITAVDLLLGEKKVGESVVVLGGGLVGCETALDLAQKVKRVTIVEQQQDVAVDMFWRNRNHLIKLLAAADVAIWTNTKALEITDEGLVVADTNGRRMMLEADTILLAVGYQPNRELFEVSKDRVKEAYAIGDCVQTRKLIDAIWEGFAAARLI